MRLSLIVAVAENGVIGRDNALPWRLRGDLRFFKQTTMGKPMLMGRKTFDSLGKPLPGRPHLVVSRQQNLKIEGAEVFSSLDTALDKAAQLAGEGGEVMLIGGAQLYAEALPRADRIYLTEVHANVDGDARFPTLDRSQWREVSCERHRAEEGDTADYSFVVLERKRS